MGQTWRLYQNGHIIKKINKIFNFLTFFFSSRNFEYEN